MSVLQSYPVPRKKLQLVGVTALLVASKYEEILSPDVADLVYITDDAYTSNEIREMEMIILKELNFDLGRPLPIHFLRRASKAGEVGTCPHCLALSCIGKASQDGFWHFYNLTSSSLNAGWTNAQLWNSTVWSKKRMSLWQPLVLHISIYWGCVQP